MRKKGMSPFKAGLITLGSNSTIAVDAGSESDQPSRLHFVVADTGIGISEQAQQRLFQPFADTKTSRRGSGLGSQAAEWAFGGGQLAVGDREPRNEREVSVLAVFEHGLRFAIDEVVEVLHRDDDCHLSCGADLVHPDL